jgi:hypothetical protein
MVPNIGNLSFCLWNQFECAAFIPTQKFYYFIIRSVCCRSGTNAGFTLLLTIDKFVTFPTDILPRISGSALTPLSSWAIGLNYGYFVSSVVSFLITWTATCLLLRHYTHKLGNVKYWIILAIPLGYFLSQFVILVGPFIQADPVTISIFLTLLFTLSKPIGGILFGIAFWIMSRSISSENVVRNYLTISACGLVILFTSNQAIVLLTAPYPPFGLATVSFVGLSSYFILVGICSSAISVSLDIGLRKSIRKSVEDHSKFSTWYRTSSNGPRDTGSCFKGEQRVFREDGRTNRS